MDQSVDKQEAHQYPLPRGRHDEDALMNRLTLVESTLRDSWLEGVSLKSLAQIFTERTGARTNSSGGICVFDF